MHVVDLLRLAVTGLLLWLLRPHLAVIWRYVLPRRVRHRVEASPAPAGPWSELLGQLGFVHLGRREERIPGLERRGYQVFYHDDGVYADLPESALEATGPRGASLRRPPAGLYLTSVLPESLFLITKRVGTETTRGLYVSQRAGGPLVDMLRVHRAALLRLGLGQRLEMPGSLARRAEIFELWHRDHARAELRNFAVLSVVLTLIVGGFLVRVWMV